MTTKQTTDDIENVEIRSALYIFFEQSHLLAEEVGKFNDYCAKLKRPITPDIRKYVDLGKEHLKTVSIARGAYDAAKDTADRRELDRRMMALVTESVNDVIELRGGLQIEFTKLRALHEVRPSTGSNTLGMFSNSCIGVVAFCAVIGFFIYLFTR